MMRTIFILFLIAVILGACRKDPGFQRVDLPLTLTIEEKLIASGNQLMLHFSTTKQYACSNYSLNTTSAVSNSGITIQFIDITIPEICLTSIGPASTTINAGQIRNGVYSIQMLIEQQTINGRIEITDQEIKTFIDPNAAVVITNPVIQRIPNNAVWGIVGYPDQAWSAAVQQFYDTLEAVGASSQVWASGNYFHFSVDNLGTITTPANTGYHYAQSYVYLFSGNAELLDTAVARFGRRYQDTLYVSLYDGKGRQLFSWR